MTVPVRFVDVWRRYGEHPVLTGLDFAVQPGEIYALLGRNGAGKTTALNVLLGFLEPMRGRAEVFGVPATELGPAERGRVGLVTEGHRLYGWMRVREVLDFEAATRPGFDRDWARREAGRLGLPDRQRVRSLSRGQRAQLALVAALAGKPDLLVLDDPALGLDAVVRREFLEAMIELLGEEGRSVLFSSHVLADVERVADRVGILHRGRLIVDARVDSLRRRVQRRFARIPRDRRAELEALPGVLSARPLREGLELTLLDVDPAREALLRERVEHLSDPVAPTLEEIFVELTTREERAEREAVA